MAEDPLFKPLRPLVLLTAVDQTMPSTYLRFLYIFPFPNHSARSFAAKYLQNRLQATIETWPILAGRVLPSASGTYYIAIEYDNPPPKITRTEEDQNLNPKMFKQNVLDASKGWNLHYRDVDFQNFDFQNFEAESRDPTIFSQFPHHSAPGQSCPAMGLQANWLDGGLILCFAFHHAVADGYGIKQILERFAGRPFGGKGLGLTRPLASEWGCPSSPVIIQPVQYDFRRYEPMALPNEEQQTHVSKTLRFTKASVDCLKMGVGLYLMMVPEGRISETDCLSAMIWICVMRSRWSRRRRVTQRGKKGVQELRAHEVSCFNMTVNARKELYQPVPDDYIGNCHVVTTAAARVDELLAGSGKDMEKIALIAIRIRYAIFAANADYVHQHCSWLGFICTHTNEHFFPDASYFERMPQWAIAGESTAARDRALSPARTGLDCNSWADLPTNLDFGIPNVTSPRGVPEWVLKPWSTGPGTVDILPRKSVMGGAGGDWNVLLRLTKADMDGAVREIRKLNLGFDVGLRTEGK